ncbi:MAG TPA: RluA family pseudouridine synthase [Kiritimatiellia bacterium]|jgi:23S rRNA pseudouridine1911/1915/1917 synthase|nr:RluA family pseudouridine synthase [Kiritimatiellia bacterium]HOR96784.1 RluA family pseudouridine synthase [Kiritimatiellia bacterium]HPC49064.1 RluA family pseudouridine synthase [Kiritimatiellia bacterium]HPK36782.1 RluA family pseudouridine synthase [Kiritimatiellia bacterium]HPW74363.1 RluA family pseudouridine synthase [Kiritimatiellia bacterium]
MSRAGVLSFVVSKSEAGQSVQVFLAAKLSRSRRAVKALLDERVVWVNRKCVWMAHHTLRQGDTVELPAAVLRKGARDANPVAVPKIRLLIEDAEYAVVDKPSGLLTVGAGSVEERLRAQTGIAELKAVHRLDRDTTGCLLCAKTPEAFDAAVELFKTRRVTKQYHTIVSGRYERHASTVDQELDGERAVSHIQRIMLSRDASFLKVRIETGRTHQIRRHLAAIRHPVLGDRKYGVKVARDPRLLSVPRLMLHASGLGLPHPMRPGKTLQAHSPLPADFRHCLKLFDMGK